MAYALAVNEMKILFSQMSTEGTVTRGSLGTVVRDVSTMRAYEKNQRDIPLSQSQGALVTYIAEYSAAEGILQVNDILLSIDGTEINNAAELRQLLYSYKPGDEIVISVFRDGEQREESAVLQ